MADKTYLFCNSALFPYCVWDWLLKLLHEAVVSPPDTHAEFCSDSWFWLFLNVV